MSSQTNRPNNGPIGAYEEAIKRMEQFVRDTDCLQGIYAERAEYLLRLDSLSIQQKNLEGALLIVILGGTGVGKSTVINAIAGEEVARVSPIRPCTTAMTFYSHRENDLSHIDAVITDEDHWKPNDSPGLRRKILVDPPDFDSMTLSNRRKLLEVLRVADMILCVVDPEKYRNHSLYRLLYRFREGRSFLFLMNKSDYGIEQAVVDDFREALVTAGIHQPRIFLASALKAFEARIGKQPNANTGDFSDLEGVIRNEIDKAEIDRIKRSNFAALIRHTYDSIEQALPPDLLPEVEKLPEWTGKLALDTASRSASEISRVLIINNDKLRRFLQSAGSLSIGGVFGLYLTVTEKLSSLIAPRLGGSRAQDPVELRAEVQKALDQVDVSRIEILVDRFSSECTTKIGSSGVRPDSPEIKELALNNTQTTQEIFKQTGAVARGMIEAYIERSIKGWWKNVTYNILPLTCIVYFTYVAIVRITKGEMLDISFLLTFLVFLGAICILQHVFAERGFRRRGGRFMKQLEKSVEEHVQKIMEETALPKIRAFSESLTKRVQDFLNAKKLIR